MHAAMSVPGRGTRRAIALVIGAGVGIAAMVGVYLLMFRGAHPMLVQTHETGRMWWMLAVIGLIFGSTAHGLSFGVLERSARRAAEAERVPRARARER